MVAGREGSCYHHVRRNDYKPPARSFRVAVGKKADFLRIAAQDGALLPSGMRLSSRSLRSSNNLRLILLSFAILWNCIFEDEGSGFYCRAAGFLQSQCIVGCRVMRVGYVMHEICHNPREVDLGVFWLFSAQINVTSIFSDDIKESTERFSHWVVRHIPESCLLASSM